MSFLSVYWNKARVGILKEQGGGMVFTYDAAYNGPALSESLPLQKEPFAARQTQPFFDGLLPDGRVRIRLAQVLKMTARNSFALLSALGGECAGAIRLLPPGTDLNAATTSYQHLPPEEAKAVLDSLPSRPFQAGIEGVRMSAAGAQPKIMVCFIGDDLAIPLYDTPSTHIVKPANPDFPHSVENEFFSMRLAQTIGLPTAETQILPVKDSRCYCVRRYDRIESSAGVTRLHQEDFCQALGISPFCKYEREGGPGLTRCFDLLSTQSQSGVMPGRDKITLLQAIIFNFCLGNGDAHGKNFSLLYTEEGTRLAPLYDLLCTVRYNAEDTMAMSLSGEFLFSKITRAHFVALADSLRIKSAFVLKTLDSMATVLRRTAPRLSEEFNATPQTASPIYAQICQTIDSHCRQVSP